MVAPVAVAPRYAEDRLSSRPLEAVAAVAKVRTMASVEVEVAQRGGPVALTAMVAAVEPRARKVQAALKTQISTLATRAMHLCVVPAEVGTSEVARLPVERHALRVFQMHATTSPGEGVPGTRAGSETAR